MQEGGLSSARSGNCPLTGHIVTGYHPMKTFQGEHITLHSAGLEPRGGGVGGGGRHWLFNAGYQLRNYRPPHTFFWGVGGGGGGWGGGGGGGGQPLI